MIYLLKSAATSEYLQQNLKILSLPEGSTGPIQYARRWVAPDVWERIQPGHPVCIVFGDRPYQHLIPVRHAAIVDAEWSPNAVALTVKLGPLVRLRGSQALGPRFTVLNQEQYFVVSDNTPPTFDLATGSDLAHWKSIVKDLVRPT